MKCSDCNGHGYYKGYCNCQNCHVMHDMKCKTCKGTGEDPNPPICSKCGWPEGEHVPSCTRVVQDEESDRQYGPITIWD